MERVIDLLETNGLVFAFLVVGLIILFSYKVSKVFTNEKIPGAAIAIFLGLALAYFGGEKGLASIPGFAGIALLGGPMMRDFSVVSTTLGADFNEIKKAGLIGVFSLFVGVVYTFFAGAFIAYYMGVEDLKSCATLGAGACSFLVGPITGTALGASSDMIAISVAIGVVKSIVVTIGTPMMAKVIGLKNPHTAMIFGGIMGTTSGVTAGLAATDAKLVPYGAITATFYTGLAVLLCPSVLYGLLGLFL